MNVGTVYSWAEKQEQIVFRINFVVGYFLRKIVRYYYIQWDGKLKIFYVETFMRRAANKLSNAGL